MSVEIEKQRDEDLKIFRQPTKSTGKHDEEHASKAVVYPKGTKFAFCVSEDINPGAGYVMAYLRQQGYECRLFFDPKQGDRGYQRNKIVSSLFNVQDWLIKEMKEYKPDVACFSVLSATYQWGVKFAERVKREVGCRIIFGGTMPTLVPEIVSENWFIDEVVQGDGVRHFGGKLDPDNLWPVRDDFFRELPPEHRKTQLFMTSYGCPYNCTFCLPEGTPVLDDKLVFRKIEELQEGDKIVGFEGDKIVKSTVLETYKRKDYVYEITLENGDIVFSTEEHPWFVVPVDGASHWVDTKDLKSGESLKKIASVQQSLEDSDDYKTGWMKGMILGDGSLGTRKIRGRQFKRFQLVTDDEALDAFQVYAEDLGMNVHERKFNGGIYYKVDRCLVAEDSGTCERLEAIQNCVLDNDEMRRGFLAGVFDSEGSWSCNILRVSNRNTEFKEQICDNLRHFNFKCKVEPKSVILHGGRSEQVRFICFVNNHVTKRRQDIFEKTINGRNSTVKIVSVKKKEALEEVYNLKTSTENFTAWGYITHNCGNQQLREVGQYVKMKRSVDGCIKELKYMKEKWGLQNVLFVDDILTLDKKWLMEFLPKYRAEINCPFACFGHVNCLDEEEIAEMAKSKCQTIWLGIQSGCSIHRKQILDRPETNEDIIKVSEWIKKYGIKLMVDHICGLPYESDYSYDMSFHLYEKIQADVINVYECLYFPKAKINEYALECGYLKPEDIDRINRGQHVIYQQGNKSGVFYNKYSKGLVSIPLKGAAWEFLPMALIKLIVHIRAGRGYIANAMIQNELFFAWNAILKKLGIKRHAQNYRHTPSQKV